MIKDYYFFSIGSFPYGNAATNRAISYMRGFVELNCNVTLYVLAPDKNQSTLSNNRFNNYKGVNIIYTCPLLYTSKGLFRILNYLIGILIGYFILLKILFKYKGKVPLVLLFVHPIIISIFLTSIKLFRAKAFHERTEFPFLNKKNTLLNNFYLKKLIPSFNGIYVISNSLVDYFMKLTTSPILHLPMTVEFDRFLPHVIEKKQKYVAYCGSMYTDKDGVPDLIDAFTIVANINKEIFLYLIGDNSDEKNFKYIKEKIISSTARDRIICTGNIERDDMPNILNNATILALCRPSNLQSHGGFPTKLGEYLATSNPVVITDVGEITLYLKHRVSAFIAKPNNPDDFALKLLECLSDNELALKVGKSGYEVALSFFNYKKQAALLKDFIEFELKKSHPN
jgi:glycosyltransferase involved in cell wall biosynthesis